MHRPRTPHQGTPAIGALQELLAKPRTSKLPAAGGPVPMGPPNHPIPVIISLLFITSALSVVPPCPSFPHVYANIPAGIPVRCVPRHACVELAGCSVTAVPSTTSITITRLANIASGESWLSGALVSDLDGDGWREIVTFSYQVNVYNASGTITGRIFPQGVLADLDLDGRVEIIFVASTQLFAYNWTPTGGLVIRAGFPVTLAASEVRGLSVYDLDGDGLLEMVASCTAYPGLAVINATGQPYQPTGNAAWLGGPMANPAWPRYNNIAAPTGDVGRNGASANPAPLGFGQNTAVYDLDRDGLAEVVWSASNNINIFRLDGYSIDTVSSKNGRGWTWGQQYYRWANLSVDQQYWFGPLAFPDETTVEYNRFETSPPTFADLDGDSIADVVVVAEATVTFNATYIDLRATQLQAYYFMPAAQRGMRIPSVSQRSNVPLCLRNGACTGSATRGVAVADLDFDGVPELIFPGGDGFLYCTNNKGTVLWAVDVAQSAPNTDVTEPVVADLDGDGALEVIVASQTPLTGSIPWFFVINAAGSVLYQAQMSGSTGGNGIGAGGVSVIDRLGNGKLTILVSTFGGTLVYSVNTTGVSKCAQWPVQRGGTFRRGQRDYEVFWPNSCPYASAALTPPANITGYTQVEIDLRLLKGVAPAVVLQGAAVPSFTVSGTAAAANYTINFSQVGNKLVATLAPTTPPPPTTSPPPATGLPVGIPITGYVFIEGDVALGPNATLTITVNPAGGGGYVNVSGCVDLAGTLDINVDQAPAAGQNVSFLESPCITLSGSSSVKVTNQPRGGCGVEGTVGAVDDRRLGVLFYAKKCGNGGLSKGAIAGIVIAVVLLVGVATAAAIVFVRRSYVRRLHGRPSSRRGWGGPRTA